MIVRKFQSRCLSNAELVAAYYYLQAGDYQLAKHRKKPTGKDHVESDQQFLDSLVPSYLSFDNEGRVLRIESFSSAYL